jgi:hypothetical protein
VRRDEVDPQFGYGPVALLLGAHGGHGDDPFPYVIDGWFAPGIVPSALPGVEQGSAA